MIEVALAGDHFVVNWANRNAATNPLNEPLHQIFLRSTLRGTPSEDGSWSIPTVDNPLEQLNRVVAHFVKYALRPALDETCSALLAGAREEEKRFTEILRTAKATKHGRISASVRTSLRLLNRQLARKPTTLQRRAISHLVAVQNGANFSVPGSGKTTVALGYYGILRKQGLVDSILVIGPLSSFEPWEREYQLCFGRAPRAIRLAGRSRSDRIRALATSYRYEVFLTSYQSAARDIAVITKFLRSRKALVILDESHYIKRPQGGVLAETVLALAKYAQRRVVLSGTPMPNGIGDLWSQITFLWPSQKPLDTSEQFLRLVNASTDAAVERIRKQVSPLIYRVTKKQLGLPRPQFRIAKCEMSPLQLRIYRGVAAKYLTELSESTTDKDSLREWRRARAVRLLQIAVNPGLLRQRSEEFGLPPLDVRDVPLRDAIEHYATYELPNKVALACAMVRRLCAQRAKVLVWSTFIHNLRMVAQELKDLNPIVVHGGIPTSLNETDELGREALIGRFRDDPESLVLIANPAACAESISLHMSCHNAIYLDRSFNCAHYLQSLDRIHRLGLKKTDRTSYYLLLSKGSIDEVVHVRLLEKQQAMRDVIEGELPPSSPGYWSEDLGDEEVLDMRAIERHITELFTFRARQAA